MRHRKNFNIQDESILFAVGVFPTSGGTSCCISKVCVHQHCLPEPFTQLQRSCLQAGAGTDPISSPSHEGQPETLFILSGCLARVEEGGPRGRGLWRIDTRFLGVCHLWHAL